MGLPVCAAAGPGKAETARKAVQKPSRYMYHLPNVLERKGTLYLLGRNQRVSSGAAFGGRFGCLAESGRMMNRRERRVVRVLRRGEDRVLVLLAQRVKWPVSRLTSIGIFEYG